MFLSNAAIKRPVAMSCLIIGLALLGLNAARKMSLELMPKSDLPFITIITVYPGAGPGEIETDVAKRIEDSVGTIDGLKHIASVSMDNMCQTLLEFELGVDVDIAATDVREKLDLVRASLPSDVEDPMIQKFDINATPVVTLALTGDVPLAEMFDYADNDLRDRVSIIRGVADVDLIGGARREVHVTLDRGQLAARGLSSLQVVRAIREGVGLIPVGRVDGDGIEYNIKFDADYDQLSRMEDMEVIGNSGRRCYIRDIGKVSLSTAKLRRIASLDGNPCVAIRIIKKADANAAAVAERVRASFASLEERLPGGMKLDWITDDGSFIRATNRSAWINVLQGIALTAAVLFVFLYNLRSLLVVCITMPLTIVIGLFFMHMSDFTLNTSTLIAIGMSIGILVTNSIVVLEAIVKRLDETGDPEQASRLGAKEAFIAVLASAGTNMVVLFPLATMGSLLGVFFRPLAWTMFIMTVVSLFLSFSLTPMLCSLLLKPHGFQGRGLLRRMETGWNRGFDRVVDAYAQILRFSESHRWAAILVLVAVLGMLIHSFWLGGKLGFGFMPDIDRAEIFVKLEFPTRNSLGETSKRVDDAVSRLSDLPELKHTLVTIGKVEGTIGQSSEGVHLAQILLRFSERTERRESMDDLVGIIRERMSTFPGAIVAVSIAGPVGGQSTAIEMEISGDDLEVLDSLALKAKELADGLGGFRDIDTTVRAGKPEIRVSPDRPILADLGMPATALGLNLRASIEGMDAGVFKRSDRTYDIVVKLEEKPGQEQVEHLLFPGAPGRPIPLTGLAQVESDIAPVQITRVDKRRVSKLLSNLSPELPLGLAIQQMRTSMEDGVLPPGYDLRFAGMAEVMGEGQAAMGEAGVLGIILVVLALAAILESFRQPVLILVTLPLGLIGMLWALALAGAAMDMFVMMGTVMLIGIVVNNAILIMDQFNVHVSEGVPRHKAMISAASERFRPIAMITIAAVLGMLPLALGRGIGAELRNSVGIAAVGGILVSGLLTLIVMPVLYDLCTRRQRSNTRSDSKKK